MMSKIPRRNLGAAVIGALLIGLLAAPWVYIGLFGALRAFSSPFPEMAALLLILVTINLLIEAFIHPYGFKVMRIVLVVFSVSILLSILSVLTKFTLLTGVERMGLFATIWLSVTMVWLVVSMLLGGVGPEAILRLYLNSLARRRVALVLAVSILVTLFAYSWYYLITPPKFIG